MKLIRMLLIITLTTSLVMVSQNNFAVALEPVKLKIYVGPSSVPADNDIYGCVFVQLQDSNSRPARALEDTAISLSSSLISVGDVEPTITITKGNTFAMAKFYSTFTPGTTTISAAAQSYATVQTTLRTIGPIPITIAVSAFPPTIPSDGNSYPAIIVQLQDSTGKPARAPIGGLTVNLTCSNITVGTIQNNLTLQEGKTYAVADFNTNPLGLGNPALYAGTAEVIAIAQDYVSRTTTIRTQAPASNPTNLKVHIGPTVIMADNVTYERLVGVQLLNGIGVVSKTSSDVIVNIASSEPLVGTVPSTLTISAYDNIGFTEFASTYRYGPTTITAGATNYKSSTANLTTIGPLPTQLSISCNPSTLPADNQTYNTIQVQLQDGTGKPANDPDGDVTISLFSSEPNVGSVPATITIPYGKTYATTTFKSTYQAGSASIIAQASGYSTDQVLVNTIMIDQASLGVSATATPNPINSGNQTTVIAHVAYPGGSPVTGASVKFTSSGGGTFSTVTEIGDGSYNTTFKAPSVSNQTDVNVTATASKTDYATSVGIVTVTVLQPPPLEVSVTATPNMIDSGNQSDVVAYVTYLGGAPVTGATVKFTSSGGGTFSTVRQLGNGFYNATFKAPSLSVQTDVTVTATASKTDFATSTGTTQVTILPLPSLDVVVTTTLKTLNSGDQANLVAYVTYQDGSPVRGATLKFTSSSGGTFTTVREFGSGYYNTTFKAPNLNNQTETIITATASKLNYATSTGTTQITVLKLVPVTPGTLTLCIKDDTGQPVSEAIVSTLAQPTGMKKLMDVTNSTGYVAFPNATEGTYTINVNKQGYQQINQTLSFKTDSSVKTLFIQKTAGAPGAFDWTVPLLILVAVIVVVVVVVVAFLQKRKTAARFKVPKKWTPPPPPPKLRP